MIEFYRTMEINVDFENHENDNISALVGGREITITPSLIADYLEYPRPAYVNINYPDPDVDLDIDQARRAVYIDIAQYTGHNAPGLYKEHYRLVNKTIHYNLFPRGAEHRPTEKALELLYVFVDVDFLVDWAKWIFQQIIEVRNDSTSKLRLPLPCMITAMCKAQGVKVVDKDYVAGDPGPINADRKSVV